MINLPISSHKPQSADNAASALPADILATGTQSVAPFAFLLAQQIDVADLSAPDATLTAIAMDSDAADNSVTLQLKDAQDQTATAANMPGDPTGIIAAILQQLPALEERRQQIDARQTTQTLQTLQTFSASSPHKTEGAQTLSPFTFASPQKTDNLQTMSGFSQETGRNRSVEVLASNQIMQASAIDHPSSEAIKHAEFLSGLTQPALSATQTVASPSGYSAMPGTLASNILPPVATSTVATPLDHHGWADEFSQKISWIGTQQIQIAELHLNPPNLGPLDVVLKISDNQATALFTSPHGAVRDAVENALPKLREILADNGIMLGNTTISDQSPRDRGTDGFMGQGFGATTQQEIDDAAAEAAGSSPATAQTATVRRHNGMVDTFA